MTDDFEQLISQNSGRIRRIALRYADPGESDDMIQEILLALWQSRNTFRGEARMETWVYRVALNTAFAGVRRSVSRRKGANRFAGLYKEESIEAGLAHKDILTEFLNALNEMDASIMMMTLDGMSPAEIEKVTGTSANAISVRINRIKQKYIDTYVDQG